MPFDIILAPEAVEDFKALKSNVRSSVRAMLEKRVRAIPAARRNEIIYPTWANRPDEPWTLPKTLRRALEHELEHLAEL